LTPREIAEGSFPACLFHPQIASLIALVIEGATGQSEFSEPLKIQIIIKMT